MVTTCSRTSRPRVLTWRPCGSAWRATPACWVRSAAACARPLAAGTCGSWEQASAMAPAASARTAGCASTRRVVTARSTRTRSRCCRRARLPARRGARPAPRGTRRLPRDRRGRAHPQLWGADHPHTDEDEIADYLGLTYSETFYGYVDPGRGLCARGPDRARGPLRRHARRRDPVRRRDGRRVARSCWSAPVGASPGKPRPRALPDLLRAARRAERISRHKANPNCPTLGERGPLLAAGILTDALPGD